jgi:hypothetical protein
MKVFFVAASFYKNIYVYGSKAVVTSVVDPDPENPKLTGILDLNPDRK